MTKRIPAALAALALILASVFIGSPAHAANTYFYAVGNQTGVVADGAAFNITVENPYVTGTSAHSIGQMVVQSADLQQRVEVGWRKGAGAGQVPKLFTYHAINGVGQGYNLCTDYAAEPVNVGADLSAWASVAAPGPRFQIINTGTAWWVAFNLKWVCHFPNSLWTNAGVTFNKINTIQAYGEVVSTTTATPCTDMGDGQFGSSGTAAQIGSYSLQGQTSGPAPSLNIYTTPATAAYTVSVVTPNVTFRYGGRGYSAAGTLPGVQGGC
jgi:hypothetical protein